MGKKASGKFVIRMAPSMHEAIRARAEREGVSLNKMSQRLIQEGLRACQELPQEQAQIIAKAKELYGDSFTGLVLFGSAARGEAGETSDVDLLLVLDEKIPLRRDLYRAWHAEFGEMISLHIVAMAQDAASAGSIWLECALDGKVLYDLDGRVTRMLVAIRDLIVSGKVIRKVTHGQGYWVHI